MNKIADKKDLNRIEKRAIEASAIAPVIKILFEKMGKKEALAILRDVNEKEAFQRGKDMMKSEKNNGINELVKDVATWGDGGFFEIDVLEETSNTYFFNVHKCPYFQKYEELGLTELGVDFSCCRDKPFARGLNPKLKLVRTKTIMEGADFCDFRYSLESE